MNVILTVSSQGQVVIPVKVRKILGLKSGSKVTLSVSQARGSPSVILEPQPESWVKYASGRGKGIWGIGEDYIEKERGNWDKT
ncbi:hypothetical protein A3A59_03955 [Candidatus Gottesmanbacteria bacterium RIFCSPLOWO2_01_FULL_42_10]|nr:MAG: hypothetical protein A2699_04400 [Candidatus Gottesmanbacteria bacterium RIFCSPHIGHO2_01_FULL_43_15]OGG28154.1 MAG: hypothetical protein A3A59_03955 [Candidatus Gottesmanbacteria bacterium RIFCSPLOWO2_01_FULL_42_10]